MAEPGEWIQGDDVWAGSALVQEESVRWRRRVSDSEFYSINSALSVPWGGTFPNQGTYFVNHGDRFPEPVLGESGIGFFQSNATDAQLWSAEVEGREGEAFEIGYSPVVTRFGVAPGVGDYDPLPPPPQEWPDGATGYEYESPYGEWYAVDSYRFSVRVGRAWQGETVDDPVLHHPISLLRLQNSALSDPPEAQDFPHRGNISARPEVFRGVIPPATQISEGSQYDPFAGQWVSGLWPVAQWTQTEPKTTVLAVPSWVRDGYGYVNGRSLLHTIPVYGERRFRPPRHRFLFAPPYAGSWERRQMQTLGGGIGSWPKRQMQAGGRTGTWHKRHG